MPRRKVQNKKSTREIEDDLFDFDKEDSGGLESGMSDVDLMMDKITQEMEDAKAEAERRQRISVSNRETRKHGRMFEEMIERACEVYKAEGRAVIKKIPEPRRVVGRTGGRKSMMICVNEKKADPDFQGSLAPDGKFIVFDAKHTDKEKILKNALTETQAEMLDAHLSCGAACYVAVSFGFERFFLIPYAVWKDMKSVFGRQYILPDDDGIQTYAVPFGVTGYDKNKNPLITVWFLGQPDKIPEIEATEDREDDFILFD